MSKSWHKYIALGVCALIVVLLLNGCRQAEFPKPYAYFRIDLPEATYSTIDFEKRLQFEMSDYAVLKKSDEESGNYDIWRNIEYPQWNARVHLSYKQISAKDFYDLVEESRSLAYKHTIRADGISELYYENPELHTYGIFYQMSGNAASPAQFFITDSTTHFLRGSLYFNHTPNFDSIAPVSRYIEADMMRLVESLEWE